MIIRSQDKKTLTNFQQVTDVGVVKTDGVFEVQVYYPFSLNDEYSKMCLGTYSTEEKAIKVLDMIQQKFLQYGVIEHGFNTESVFVIPRCYQMPSDEEVEV